MREWWTNVQDWLDLRWQDLEAWSTADRISVIVAFLALVAAGWGVRYARRSARATEEQAAATGAQAAAAVSQVEVMEQQLLISSPAYTVADRIGEVGVLLTHRAHLAEILPRVEIAIEDASFPVHLDDAPVSQQYVGDRIIFDQRAHGDSLVSVPVRGVLENVGQVAAKVAPDGPRLIEGRSALREAEFHVPPRLEKWTYLLRPGEAALFEWGATLTLDDWIDIYIDRHRGEFVTSDQDRQETRDQPIGRFHIWPAGMPLYGVMRIDLIVDSNIVWPYGSSRKEVARTWSTPTQGSINVIANHEVDYGQSLNDLRKRFKSVDIYGRVEDDL